MCDKEQQNQVLKWSVSKMSKLIHLIIFFKFQGYSFS